MTGPNSSPALSIASNSNSNNNNNISSKMNFSVKTTRKSSMSKTTFFLALLVTAAVAIPSVKAPFVKPKPNQPREGIAGFLDSIHDNVEVKTVWFYRHFGARLSRHRIVGTTKDASCDYDDPIKIKYCPPIGNAPYLMNPNKSNTKNKNKEIHQDGGSSSNNSNNKEPDPMGLMKCLDDPEDPECLRLLQDFGAADGAAARVVAEKDEVIDSPSKPTTSVPPLISADSAPSALNTKNAGSVPPRESASSEPPVFDAKATGSVPPRGSASSEPPVFDANAAGSVPPRGSARTEPPVFDANAAGSVPPRGSANSDSPVFDANAAGSVPPRESANSDPTAFTTEAGGQVSRPSITNPPAFTTGAGDQVSRPPNTSPPAFTTGAGDQVSRPPNVNPSSFATGGGGEVSRPSDAIPSALTTGAGGQVSQPPNTNPPAFTTGAGDQVSRPPNTNPSALTTEAEDEVSRPSNANPSAFSTGAGDEVARPPIGNPSAFTTGAGDEVSRPANANPSAFTAGAGGQVSRPLGSTNYVTTMPTGTSEGLATQEPTRDDCYGNMLDGRFCTSEQPTISEEPTVVMEPTHEIPPGDTGFQEDDGAPISYTNYGDVGMCVIDMFPVDKSPEPPYGNPIDLISTDSKAGTITFTYKQTWTKDVVDSIYTVYVTGEERACAHLKNVAFGETKKE
jgi:hypothetical protein